MKGRKNLLCPEDLPDDIQQYFDFDSQSSQPGKGRNIQILRTCSSCGKQDWVIVKTVRTTKCTLCKECNYIDIGKRKLKPLEPEEIPEELRITLDFSSQDVEFKDHPRVTIVRVCPYCGERKRVSSTHIRTLAKSGNYTGKCLKCCVRKGEANNFWKGGRTKSVDGYVYILADQTEEFKHSKYIAEHRLVMERHIGRPLLPTETVHHKNGIRDDNRLENLELFLGKHGSGARYKDLSNNEIQQQIDALQRVLSIRGAL